MKLCHLQDNWCSLDYHMKWTKPVWERQISYGFSHLWFMVTKIHVCIYKMKLSWRTKRQMGGGRRQGMVEGVGECTQHTVCICFIFKLNKQTFYRAKKGAILLPSLNKNIIKEKVKPLTPIPLPFWSSSSAPVPPCVICGSEDTSFTPMASCQTHL